MKKQFAEFSEKIKGVFLRNLDFRHEKEDEMETIESIRKGIEFKGTNLWVLVFAIFTACLGLNINSTAVLIGAMLISPLMGPIMGFGLGMGINDFELFKKSLRNLGVAAFYSVLASTLYFLISPPSGAQSELLARTQPTIYDVLIAFFGGCAGIIASCSKSKGNVIPGVAISTALLPPLCTAGFGIATGNLNYFFGATYLFLINTVFIALATFFVVRILKFPIKVQVNSTRQKQVSRIITIITCTIIPCIFLTSNMLRKNIFENSANSFIAKELSFPGTYIIDKKINQTGKEKEIKVVMVGKSIPETTLLQAENRLSEYGLNQVKLTVTQGVRDTEEDVDALKLLVMKDFYEDAQATVENQSHMIDSLRLQLKKYEEFDRLSIDLIPEFKALFPKVQTASISRTWIVNIQTGEYVPTTLVYLKVSSRLTNEKREAMVTWLKARTNSVNLELIEL